MKVLMGHFISCKKKIKTCFNSCLGFYPKIYANSIHKSLKIEESGEWQG